MRCMTLGLSSLIAVFASAVAATAMGSVALGVDARQQPGLTEDGSTEEDLEAVLAAWREEIDLDLAHRVLEAAGPRVRGGDLARHGEARALLVRALLDRGRDREARALLKVEDLEEGTRVHVILERARMHLLDDELREAAELLGEPEGTGIRALYPEHPECWLLLGRTLVRIGAAPRAVPLLERFLQMAPRHPEGAAAWHMLSQAALVEGNIERSKGCTERARELGTWYAYYRARRIQIREDPTAALPRLGLAKLWIEAEDSHRARSVIVELLELHPTHASAWFHLGEIERTVRDFEGARRAYDRALGFDPELAPARFNRATLHRLEGRGPFARADYEALLAGPSATDPRYLEAHLWLARLLEDAGEGPGAEARHRRYTELGGTEPLKPR